LPANGGFCQAEKPVASPIGKCSIALGAASLLVFFAAVLLNSIGYHELDYADRLFGRSNVAMNAASAALVVSLIMDICGLGPGVASLFLRRENAVLGISGISVAGIVLLSMTILLSIG
jgi:hypothetical protein